MENRHAWRILDYLKDIFMHHRKFTPFQKLVFSSVLVGVSVCLFRNLWILTFAVTYAVTMYCAMVLANYVHRSRTCFASDQLLVSLEKFHEFLTRLADSFLSIENTDSRLEKDTAGLKESAKGSDNEFFDAIEQTPDIQIFPADKQKPMDNNVIQEIEIITGYIRRDFIQSWYGLFGTDDRVMEEADAILHGIKDNVEVRLKRADIFEIAQHILAMFRGHVHAVKQAQLMYKVQKRRRKSATKLMTNTDDSQPVLKTSQVVYKSVEECFGSKVELHTAMRSEESEQAYLKSVVELLVLHLLPTDMHDSKAVVCALSEILMCNVLQNVMSLLSGTTFLHEKIILITSDERPCICIENTPVILVTESDSSHENVQSILINRKPASLTVSKDSSHTANAKDKDKETLAEKVNMPPETHVSTDATEFHEVQWKEDLELHPVSKGMCNECNRLCSKDKDKISPRPHSCSLGTSPVFFDIHTDPDRHSLSSQNSISSREGSPVFQYPMPVLPECASGDSLKTNIDSSKHSDTSNKSQSLVNGELSDSNTDHHEHDKSHKDADKKDIAHPEADIKQNLNILGKFTGNFHLPKTLTSMLPKRSSSVVETMEESPAGKLEIKSSKSSDELRKDQGGLTPTTPGEASLPWPEDGPSVFQDVRISATETAKEPGSSSQYTLYIVEYEALYHSEEGELVHKTGMVRRRFREFENLQSRLESNSDYKKSMKDVKGPKKMLPNLPFGNMGQQTVDSRKKLLETFLTSLIKRTDICNGEEMKQFLGYSGDGHIAFVKAKTDATAARIDQKLVKTMSGVFDSIFEGLPSLPRQIPKIIPSFDSSDDKKEPEEKGLEDTDLIDIKFTFHGDMVHSEKMDKFTDMMSKDRMSDERAVSPNTTLGTSILGWQEEQLSISPTASSHMISRTGHMTPSTSHMTTSAGHMISGPQPMTSHSCLMTSSGSQLTSSSSQVSVGSSQLSACSSQVSSSLRPMSGGSAGQTLRRDSESTPVKTVVDKSDGASSTDFGANGCLNDTDCPVASALLDVLTELLHAHDSWVCRDNVITVTKVLLGRAISRYLEGRINHLTSEEMAVFYLSTLRDTVWPDGTLFQDPRPSYTDHQKELMHKQASRCLGDFLPDVLKLILGKEDFDNLIEEVMETIKYEKLNRHFWYSVLDVVLEKLIPEITTPELQRKLSASTERL